MHDETLVEQLRRAADALGVDDTPPVEAIAARHRRAVLRRAVVTAAAVVLVVGVAVGMTRPFRTSAARLEVGGTGPGTTVAGRRPLAPGASVTRIDAGGEVVALATRRGHAGVWALALTGAVPDAGQEVLRYDPVTDRVQRWRLGRWQAGRSAASSFTVCDSGVWSAVGNTLTHLDPATGRVDTVRVSGLGVVAAAAQWADRNTQPGVSSIACDDPSGDVVLGSNRAGVVLRYDPATGRFTRIPLPAGTVATQVVADGIGQAAIGLRRFDGRHAAGVTRSVLVADLSTGTTRVVDVDDSTTLIARDDDFVTTERGGLQVVSVPRGPGAAGVQSVRIAGADAGEYAQGGVLPDGRLVVPTRWAMAIVDPDHGGRLEHVPATTNPARCAQDRSDAMRALLRSRLQGSDGTPPNVSVAPSTTVAPGSCTDVARAVADAAGNVYYVGGPGEPVRQMGVPSPTR